MGIHSLSAPHGPHALHGVTPPPSKPTAPSVAPSSGNALPTDTAEISEEAKALNHGHSAGHNAHPKDVAESFGYSNFGQLVKALRHTEGGYHVSISGLVHKTGDVVSQVQSLLTPPAPEPGPTDEPTDTALEPAPEETPPAPVDSPESTPDDGSVTPENTVDGQPVPEPEV